MTLLKDACGTHESESLHLIMAWVQCSASTGLQASTPEQGRWSWVDAFVV